MDVLLRKHLHLNPGELDDDMWAIYWAILKDILQRESGKKK